MGTERTDELYKVLLTKGYPKELCSEIAYNILNTDYTATRMLGYLYRYTEPRIEDVIDEMIAILSDREEFIKNKSIVRQVHIAALHKEQQQIAEAVEKAERGDDG